MKNRKLLLLLCIPLIAVLVTGCSDSGSASDPNARANQKVASAPPLVKGAKLPKTPKKPKEIGNMTGPSQLVD